MKIIFSALFLFAAQTAFGQKIHEIKTDLLLPLVNGAHLGYEFIPAKRLGVELEARYRWGVNGTYHNEVPQTSPCPFVDCGEGPSFAREQKVLTLNLNAKLYFLKNSIGSGLYAGAYVREDWLLSRRDPAYDHLYVPDYYVNNPQPLQSSSLRSGVGILAGYKFLFWKHWTLEASMGLDWDYRSLFGDLSNGMDWTGIPSLKAGYRL